MNTAIAEPASAGQTAPARTRDDAAVIALVGLVHGVSHFFHLLLPPLFPAFIRDFGLNYSELGLLVSVFFLVSGVGQALSGFLVDRIGARPVLSGALVCFTLAASAAAGAQGYAGLLLAAALAGLGNAPFHPADFTILNQRVSTSRLGHAFSAHGISGNLGWAVAPLFMLGITQASGSWRSACGAAALLPLAALAVLSWQRRRIDDRLPTGAAGGPAPAAAGHGSVPAPVEHPLAFLRLPAVWLCFSFFFWVTAAMAAVQSFAGPALAHLYGLPLTATAFVVTGYMVCAALGTVAGGFLVARDPRLERSIALAMFAAAALLLLGGSGVLPALGAGLAVALAGFGSGLATPSRDMLIKRAAPPGATGRVYGTVYSGLDAGFALSSPVFGSMLDHGWTHGVFIGAALALAGGVASAALVGWRVRWQASRPGA
jgi:MFS family permease